MMLQIECRAKINLYLRVTGKRPDGFHDLITLFREIDLADTLEWQPDSTPLSLEVIGADLGNPEENLVVRAARRFGELTGFHAGGAIRLHKKIPAGGGLGGGSSNAAGMVKLLNRHYQNPLDQRGLIKLCSELGSDVPFFLQGGRQLGTGRGVDLKPVSEPESEPRQGFLFLPPMGLSTAAIFGVCHPGPDHPAEVGRNDLLPAALEVSASFAKIWNILEKNFEAPFFMTGSGSTLVWLTTNRQIAPKKCKLLEDIGVSWVPFCFW